MDADKLAEVLRDSRFVMGMLTAICETDSSVDREKAKDAAIRVLNFIQDKVIAAEATQLQDADMKDTIRLNWLNAHPRLSEIVVNGKAQTCYFYGVAGATGLKLREIIDAAMMAKRT